MNREQQVYFIKPIGMDGPIKIGCSDKPAQRLLVLAAWSPFDLEIIGSVLGTFKDENTLHRRFANLHTRKEWFMSSPLLRQTIERILAGESIAEVCKDISEKGAIRGQKRPAKTADRKLFLDYGTRIRNVVRALWRAGEGGRWEKPDDVAKIMHDWRCDKVHGHSPITPTPEQFARLEEFIANPKKHARFIEWKPVAKTPICVPHIDEIAA